jgi:hypothetical protein
MKLVVLKIVVFVFLSSLLLGCKKAYTCRCKFDDTRNREFPIYNTKRGAKITCKRFVENGYISCVLLNK